MRTRSLRLRALAVVAAMVVAPLFFVWISNLADASAGWQMQRRVERTAQQAAALRQEGGGADRLDRLAARQGVWIRVLAGGQVVDDVDHEASHRLTSHLGDLFFGPDGAPSLQDWDRRQPPLVERAEVVAAAEQGQHSGCISADTRRLLICTATLAVDGEIIVVQESSRRAIRALYDVRYQLTKLALFTLALGVILAWWLGWRMVRPLEQLREQVLDRKRASSMAPITLERDDEFGDLAAAFNSLLQALDERSRANEAFAADLVHELKNPVATVAAVAERLESGQPLDDARLARLARALRASSSRLDALASQFLELARAEAGLQSAERDPIDLSAMARGLVEGVAADARFAEVDFRLQAEEPAIIEGAAERLETALRNLLDNAARFAARAHPGGGGEVVVEVTVDGEVVQLVVADNGPGVAPEDLPRIFDRFFSRREGGTGLGLALTQAIIVAHGGRISADSAPGQGCRFTVTLPARTAGAQPARDFIL